MKPTPVPNPHRKPKIPIVIPERVAERAAMRFITNGKGCRISTYSTASHGYAQIGWKDGSYRQVVTAHRAAWVYHNGEQIPDGMTVDHTCKERRCVNPKHLRTLTNFENARRTSGRDWPLGECAHGHSNDHLRKWGGKWACSICVLDKQRTARARTRALREAA